MCGEEVTISEVQQSRCLSELNRGSSPGRGPSLSELLEIAVPQYVVGFEHHVGEWRPGPRTYAKLPGATAGFLIRTGPLVGQGAAPQIRGGLGALLEAFAGERPRTARRDVLAVERTVGFERRYDMNMTRRGDR